MRYLEKLLEGVEVEWKSFGEVAKFRRGSFSQPYGNSQVNTEQNSTPF